MARTSTVQVPRKLQSSRSKKKRSKDEQPYIALKARVLSAVYRISQFSTEIRSGARRASHPAIKKHLLARQKMHPERYPIFRENALSRTKKELVEEGLLVKPTRAAFAPSKDVRLNYKEVRDDNDESSEDEAIATAFLQQYNKAVRELPASPEDSDESDSESDGPIEVPISGLGRKGKKGKGGRSKTSSTRAKAAATTKKAATKKAVTKKRKLKAVSSESEEDQLDSSADEAPVRTKGKRPIKTKPKPVINPATGRPKGTLSRLRKAELVEKVMALQETNDQLLKTVEKQRDEVKKMETTTSNLEQDKKVLEQDKSIVERDKAILSKGFLTLKTTYEALKTRLSKYESVETETDDELGAEQDFETGEIIGVELEMEQQQDLGGYDEPMFDYHDDSGFGDVDAIIAATHKSRESSQRATPALADSHAARQANRRPSQLDLTTTGEQTQERGFNPSYPELCLDSQSQRHSPAPSARKSWASIHPPSPASSENGHAYGAPARHIQGNLEEDPGGENNIAFPSPDPSSSPVKLGSHTIQQREDDEGSVVAPTVIAEESEEDMLSIDGRKEEEIKNQRLEREIVELRTTLGEVELAKELVKQDLDIMARRYQDQVHSTKAELSNANESRLAVEEKITSLESDLSTLHQTVEEDDRRVAELHAQLVAAEAALASADAARCKNEATLQATKEDLELVSHRFQDGVTESTEELHQLDLEHVAAQERITSLGQELAVSTEQLQTAQARIRDLEPSLEQAKSAHADLVKADLERHDALLAANRSVDELAAKIQSLESAHAIEKASLGDRLSQLDLEKSQVDIKLQQATKELAEEQRRSGLLREEVEMISRRYREQEETLNAELDAAATDGVELESQVSSLEQTLSDTKAQLTEERTRSNDLQTALTNAKSSHDEMIKQKERIVVDLQTSIDELNRDLFSARSAHEALVVEKGAVESQLSVVRQQAQQTSDALEKKARTSGALKAEMDLVSQHYRDSADASTIRIQELETELSEAQEKITELEDELSRTETSAEAAKCRVEELEEKLTVADESYAELVKVNEESQAALADSSRKLDSSIADIATLNQAQAVLERSKTAMEHDLSTLQQRLDLSTEQEIKQVARLESLQGELDSMAKAYQEQGKEAAENAAIVEEQLSIAEFDAATLKEELDATHAALIKEQTHSEKIESQLQGATESCNALANDKELLRTAIVAADAKGDQLSARADRLVADLDTLRAEKATLEGHHLMLEQDLSMARAQLSTAKSGWEEEKTAAASLRTTLDAEKEQHRSALEKLDKVQVSYKVVYEAENELRSQLRSLVNSRGLTSPTDLSDSTSAPLSYISSLKTHFVDLDRQLSVSAAQLDSSQALANQLLASFPNHLIYPLHTGTDGDDGAMSLEQSLRKVLDRLSLLTDAAESASAELEETRNTLTETQTQLNVQTADASTATEYELEKVLETLDSKLRELDAVLSLPAEGETSIDIDEAPLSGHDNLPLLVEQIKTRVQSFEPVDEQRKNETRRLKEELMEEVAKRSRAVVKLKEKTEECIKLEEQVHSLKERQGKALSLIKQSSSHLEA